MALGAQVVADFSGAEAWLARAKDAPERPASWEAASAATDGGRMAEASWHGFGPLPAVLPVLPKPKDLAAFLAALKAQDLGAVAREVAPLFPAMAAPEVQIKIVANGFPVWGDLYVRRFKTLQGRATEDEGGTPAILMNACLVAGPNYGATPEAQAVQAMEVIRHEVFHVFFDTFRSANPRCKANAELKPAEDLLLTTQNEGIAHYLADQKRLRGQGFPPGKGERALEALETALIAIREGRADEALLLRANTGPFWDKYAAIAGMLFAYGLEADQGLEGLRGSLRDGPASLVLRYQEAASRHSGWPQPGPATLAWARALAGLR